MGWGDRRLPLYADSQLPIGAIGCAHERGPVCEVAEGLAVINDLHPHRAPVVVQGLVHRGEGDRRREITSTNCRFERAIATSIDAMVAGVTLPLVDAPVVLTVVTIGLTTAVLSALGLFAGQKFGALLGKRLDVVGGLVLIGLGVKTLIEHLTTE